jgi:hypothetical protein
VAGASDNAQARFAINLEGNASQVAASTGDALQDLRKSIVGSQDAIKAMSGDLRRLRGNSDDVKTAKETLKNKIEAEKAAISAATIAISKQGVTLDKLSDEAKKAAAAQEKLKNAQEKLKADKANRLNAAITAGGGPVADLASKFKALDEVLGGSNALMAAGTFAAVGLVAAIAAVTVAVLAGVVAFAKWVVEAGNAARTAGLMREAALGSAEQAANLGTQVDALAGKLATPKTKLNELATDLSKMSRLTGPEIVDTFNAVGQASEAMGDTVGNKFKDILTRGQRFQRLQINPFELQGTGVEFKDVAEQLAKNTGRSVKDAQQALFQGRVKLDVGAKAIRDVIEKRFGEVNAKKLLDVGVQFEKLKEKIGLLATGVHLEPLLKAMSTLFDLLDPSKTVTGAALKELVTIIGNDLVGAMTKGAPVGKSFFKGMVIGALELVLGFYKAKTALKPFQDALPSLKTAGELGKLAMYGLGAALGVVALALAASALAIGQMTKQLRDVLDIGGKLRADFSSGDWTSVGADLVKGLIAGIVPGGADIVDAVSTLGKKAKQALKDELGIHSPSTVFAELGEHTAAGFAQGIDEGSGGASSAASSMVQVPGGGKGGAGGGMSVTIQIDARGASKDAVDGLSDDAFLKKLTDALERAAVSAGVLVQPLGTSPSILPVGTP